MPSWYGVECDCRKQRTKQGFPNGTDFKLYRRGYARHASTHATKAEGAVWCPAAPASLTRAACIGHQDSRAKNDAQEPPPNKSTCVRKGPFLWGKLGSNKLEHGPTALSSFLASDSSSRVPDTGLGWPGLA